MPPTFSLPICIYIQVCDFDTKVLFEIVIKLNTAKAQTLYCLETFGKEESTHHNNFWDVRIGLDRSH